MKIKSSVFKNEGNIPAKYTCDGENVNPPLTFEDVPENAESLALIVDDPDAPGRTFTHWTVWNVNPGRKRIKENCTLKEAVQGQTSFGKTGYGGPCPPSGSHRYFFRLHALKKKLDLENTQDVNTLKEAMEGEIIEKAELMGLYSRG